MEGFLNSGIRYSLLADQQFSVSVCFKSPEFPFFFQFHYINMNTAVVESKCKSAYQG